MLFIALGCGMSTAAAEGGKGGAIPMGGGGSPGGSGGPPGIKKEPYMCRGVRFQFEFRKGVGRNMKHDA